jgi:hypothetical protein
VQKNTTVQKMSGRMVIDHAIVILYVIKLLILSRH